VPAENSESDEKSRVLVSAAVVSPACSRSCILSFSFLLADSVAGRFWNLRSLPAPSAKRSSSAVPGPSPALADRSFALVWLYRLWPRCLEAMVLVKPATVIHWHRQGFLRYWRWRSRSGRPSVDREVRKLIREMSSANPLWGAPRIHGELLKLGIEISQATVAKYMMRRRGRPSPT